MKTLKSILIWIYFIPVAILNGGLREYVLNQTFGEQWALPVSGVLLSVCIFLITCLLLPRMGNLNVKEGYRIGLLWACMTIMFEFILGVAEGHTFRELIAAYNPATGNMWILVIFVIALSPAIVSIISIKRNRNEIDKRT